MKRYYQTGNDAYKLKLYLDDENNTEKITA